MEEVIFMLIEPLQEDYIAQIVELHLTLEEKVDCQVKKLGDDLDP